MKYDIFSSAARNTGIEAQGPRLLPVDGLFSEFGVRLSSVSASGYSTGRSVAVLNTNQTLSLPTVPIISYTDQSF